MCLDEPTNYLGRGRGGGGGARCAGLCSLGVAVAMQLLLTAAGDGVDDDVIFLLLFWMMTRLCL